jgi:ribonuclease Z
MARLVEKQLAGIRVLGFSLAGEETVIAAPEYNVCFDIGRAPREVISIDNVCLTHGHMDHAAGVAYYFSQRNFVGNAPGRVIVHRSLAQPIQRLMAVWADIEGHPSPGMVYGVEHLEEVELRRGLYVRAFHVNHGACALGFSLIEKRHKLKPEFLGKTGPQIVELKKKGVQIETMIEVTLLTYTGDTAMGRFLDLDFVRSSQGVLIECTFFDREHCERASAGRHIHVTDLPRICAALPAAQIMLVHVTRRTDIRVAKKILEKALRPDDLARISFLMDRPPRPRGAETAPAPTIPVPREA